MPKIRKETLVAMIRDFGLAPLTEAEMAAVLPSLQSRRDQMEKLDKALDLSMVPPSAVYHAQADAKAWEAFLKIDQ